ncbi:amidohydrolase family protein [Vibrio furnissii]|uniref:amidohydrolase family protein n=1 Tax=Vibrio furnissii TaxID=29494 RepID=UPI0024B89D02|nr:amidohydrolase family protein [Vibrio furnissii]WHR50002.1 amidohydrolase family protein [Vibrio furnissii]
MNYLIKQASAIYSQSGHQDIRIQDGIITELGSDLLPSHHEHVVDARGCVVYPGFVNTHHHLAQSVLKGIPAGLNDGLGEWLAHVPYRYWPQITPEIMYCAAKLGFYELLRSGVTTCADHHYLYHANSSQEVEDAVWQAAEEMGIRFVLCRGGATVKGSHKGLAKAGVEPESLEMMLARLDHSRRRYHQDEQNAMRRLVVAPTSIVHSSTPDDLKILAEYARAHQLRMHSHLLEVEFDNQQAMAKYGCSAVEFAQRCDWLGEDVWFAHLVKATDADIALLANTQTGIAHCPTSNCRLGSGIAPVIDMAKAGMPISIGVDGSASAESGSMLQELNLTWLLHRAQHGSAATSVNGVIEWASAGGASMVGFDHLGYIKEGAVADLVLYDIQQPRMAGCHSEISAPVVCGEPAQIKASFINGKRVYQASDEDTYQGLVANVRESVRALNRKVAALGI